MSSLLEQLLADRFAAAKASFDSQWRPHTHDWLKANAVGLLVAIDLADQRLHQAWEGAKTDTAAVPEFGAALAAWTSAHQDAVKAFAAGSER